MNISVALVICLCCMIYREDLMTQKNVIITKNGRVNGRIFWSKKKMKIKTAAQDI